jgi:hypothetical protein
MDAIITAVMTSEKLVVDPIDRFFPHIRLGLKPRFKTQLEEESKMISRINNNNSYIQSSDGLDSEAESKKTTQGNSENSALITETGIPSYNTGNGKDHWSTTSHAKDSSMIDVLVSQVKPKK